MRLINIIDTDKIFEIPDDDGEYTIGRAADNDLPIRTKSLSSKHCKILVRGNKYAVADLDSSNGTFVNGNRVKQAVLKNNSILQLGSLKFRVEITADEATQADEQESAVIPENPDEADSPAKNQEPEPDVSEVNANEGDVADVVEPQEEISQQTVNPEKAGAKHPQSRKRVPTKLHKNPKFLQQPI